jgi:capsular exopolysaccharide synthesis family protein
MEDIVWHDPFKKESIKETDFENNITKNHSPSNSFADQFIGKRREDETYNGQYRQQTYNERYSDAYQSKRSIPDSDPGPDHDANQQRGSAGNEEKEPVFEYNSMQDDDRKFSSAWNFLDLKNKKQTGDLYKKILYYKKKNNYSVFNFVSSRAKEGTSTIVANLINYMNFQATEKKVLVIDTNLQSPNLHKIFNISQNNYGLIDIFNSRVGTREAITPVSSNIFLLCCGNGNARINDNVEQEKFSKLLNYCRHKFDLIVIDCPPVLSSADALSIAPAADLSFLILQSAKVQRPVVEKAKILLQNDECEIGGVVLNHVQQVIPGWVYKFI